MRGAGVALLIALPGLALGQAGDMLLLGALSAGVLVTVEYRAAAPSLLEFRDAPPFNRLRFICTLLFVAFSLLLLLPSTSASTLGQAAHMLTHRLTEVLDRPGTPVAAVIAASPLALPNEVAEALCCVSATAYSLSLAMVAVFWISLRLGRWPLEGGIFNVWVNLPGFDPSLGDDAASRLRRQAFVYLSLGVVLPFLLPMMAGPAVRWLGPVFDMSDPQTLIWTLAIWAFVPGSLLMRGIARYRVADLIQAQRDRIMAEAGRIATA